MPPQCTLLAHMAGTQQKLCSRACSCTSEASASAPAPAPRCSAHSPAAPPALPAAATRRSSSCPVSKLLGARAYLQAQPKGCCVRQATK